MIRHLIPLIAVTSLSACATMSSEPEHDPALNDFSEASLTVTAPSEIAIARPDARPVIQRDTKVRTTRLRRSTSHTVSPRTAIERGATEARIEPSLNAYQNAVQVYPFVEGGLYRLYAAPGQISDIALQPGETLISVSAGDTVRWVVGDTHSGSGANARSHILVKPISPDLQTNLMIATDKRTYHIEMESNADSYMAAVSWRYPQDEMRALMAQREDYAKQASTIIDNDLALSDLNFDYIISGDTPKWTPVRVFDDGRQVFIQMPANIATTDAPPLFVRSENGDVALVNYRMRGRYYVVDRLFAAAELRLGTKPQTIVRITKGPKRTRFARWFGG